MNINKIIHFYEHLLVAISVICYRDRMEKIKGAKRKRSVLVDAGEFVARLRAQMESKGLSQAELADRADLSRSTMTMFMAGDRKPSADALAKLADVLDVSTDYLLGRRDDSELIDLIQHEKIMELVRLFVQLSASDQERAVEMIRLMVITSPSDR